MTRRPPVLATWLLLRFGPEYCRESLAGDLIEEYHRGRSGLWYWHQVVLAVARACPDALRPGGAARAVIVSILMVFGVMALGVGTLTWAASRHDRSADHAPAHASR